MNSLDSRFLFPADRFVQCFGEAGESYHYGVGVSGLSRRNPAEHPFVINVRAAREKGREQCASSTRFLYVAKAGDYWPSRPSWRSRKATRCLGRRRSFHARFQHQRVFRDALLR